MSRAVLLVPSPEWRARVLTGNHGGRVPTATVCSACHGHEFAELDEPDAECRRCVDCGRLLNGWQATTVDALVLAWDGAPVPEGCDRALRLTESYGPRRTYTADEPARIATMAAKAGLGSVVLL